MLCLPYVGFCNTKTKKHTYRKSFALLHLPSFSPVFSQIQLLWGKQINLATRGFLIMCGLTHCCTVLCLSFIRVWWKLCHMCVVETYSAVLRTYFGYKLIALGNVCYYEVTWLWLTVYTGGDRQTPTCVILNRAFGQGARGKGGLKELEYEHGLLPRCHRFIGF